VQCRDVNQPDASGAACDGEKAPTRHLFNLDTSHYYNNVVLMPVSNPKYLGEFEQLLLFALLRLGDEAYGVTIRQEIEARTARPVPVGQVYTVLQRLEDRGLVISRQGEPTAERGGRRKRYYRLEPAGARALRTSYANLREMSSGLGAKLARLAEAGSSQ